MLWVLFLWVGLVRAEAIRPMAQPGIAISPGASGVNVICSNWPATLSLQDFGESSVRIFRARTDEEKAIAVWRSIQHLTTATGVIPKEPALGIGYVLEPLKLLNVYGGHWCDGLSRVMEMTWRSLGYRAQKFYNFGHTLADCHWKDIDGVERWHLFDVSQHWYVYDRSGKHVATKDELALDDSLIYLPSRGPIPSQPFPIQPSYVHAGHLDMKPHDMGIHLRIGETMERSWGNEGKPYYNLFGKEKRKDFVHGPYPITYGNGRLVYEPDLSKRIYKQGLFQTPTNLTCTEEDGLRPALHPSKASEKGVAIFKVSLPYVVSDAWVKARLVRENLRDEIKFSLSVDSGKTWRTIWETGGKTGIINLDHVYFCESFDPDKEDQAKVITPFGRYEYLIKIEIKAAEKISSCGLESLSVVTVFQHNLFSLPMLWPGRNLITVQGDLNPDSILRVTYVWDDTTGQRKTDIVTIGTLPYQYEILAKGKNWEDVVCRSIKIEALERRGEEISSIKKREPSSLPTAMVSAVPIEKMIGDYRPSAFKDTSYYIKQIENGKEVGQAVLALGALRDPKAKKALESVIAQDRTHPFQNKVWACQALYRSVGRSAVPMMLRILERDKSIIWPDPQDGWSQDAMWLHTAGTAAAILASIRVFDGRERAADIIAETLTGRRTATDPRTLWHGEEICWGLIKALGSLGGKKHIPLIKRFLNEEKDPDATAVAVLALGNIGDASVAPDLLSLLKRFQYSPDGLYSIEALGKIGTKGIGPDLYPFLSHCDEDFRGTAAVALGTLGDSNSIPKLKEMMERERFPWVINAAKESLRALERNLQENE